MPESWGKGRALDTFFGATRVAWGSNFPISAGTLTAILGARGATGVFLRKADQDFFRHDRTEALLAGKWAQSTGGRRPGHRHNEGTRA
jgi:hypothetical protein